MGKRRAGQRDGKGEDGAERRRRAGKRDGKEGRVEGWEEGGRGRGMGGRWEG